MNTTLKTLAVLGALSIGGAGVALAADNDDNLFMPGDCGGPRMMQGAGPGAGMRGAGPGMAGKERGFRRFDADRELTADQVRVLTEAHLIRMGNDDEYKVGQITEGTAKTYSVQILKTDGTVARTIELQKNGMPRNNFV